MPTVTARAPERDGLATKARTRTALNVVSHIDLRYGGICATTPGLCRALSATGRWNSGTVALAGPEETSPFQSGDGDLLRLPPGRLRWMTSTVLNRQLRERIEAADIVHVHGLWEEHCAVACSLARSLRKPYVVSAHGMLESWAVREKRWKKAAYAGLIERRNLRGAACLRAVTAAEIDDYRSFGLADAPFAVVPHGLDPPPPIGPNAFFERYPQVAGRPIVLFLSRLHPKKGLDLLFRAWPAVRAQHPDAQLVVAGPDSDGTQTGLLAMVREAGTESSVTFTGMLGGDLKWSAFAAATLFVLPSHSENFAVAISEAMAISVPLIVTRQCNRPEVAECGAGWIIEPDVRQLTHTICEALSMDDAGRAAMGRNGCRLARETLSWPAIGENLAGVYEWILGCGPQPGCVTDGRRDGGRTL